MRRQTWVAWAVLTAVGLGLILAPDSGARVFSFSRTHGPSALEFVGAGVLTAAWLVLDVGVWRGRRALAGWPVAVAVGVLLAVAAAAVVVWSVVLDEGWWWLGGAAVLAGEQLAAAVVVTQATDW